MFQFKRKNIPVQLSKPLQTASKFFLCTVCKKSRKYCVLGLSFSKSTPLSSATKVCFQKCFSFYFNQTSVILLPKMVLRDIKRETDYFLSREMTDRCKKTYNDQTGINIFFCLLQFYVEFNVSPSTYITISDVRN